MALVSREQALALGASPWGDANAPVVDHVFNFFTPNQLPVRDERLKQPKSFAPELGSQAVAAAAELNSGDIALA